MSVFDQRGQHVNYQYNAGGDINFGAVTNAAELAVELDKLKDEITKAQQANAIDEDTATVAKSSIIEAAKEIKAPKPKKEVATSFLEKAKTCLEGATAATGIVGAIVKAIGMVKGLF